MKSIERVNHSTFFYSKKFFFGFLVVREIDGHLGVDDAMDGYKRERVRKTI